MPFRRRYFQVHFLEWKCMNFDQNFIEVCPRGSINNIPALVQIMAWRRQGDKPLSKPMMGSFLTHICVTRPQWVKRCCFTNWGLMTYVYYIIHVYMRHWTGSALAQVMACHLFDAKPIPYLINGHLSGVCKITAILLKYHPFILDC